jgi:hypothetical protein
VGPKGVLSRLEIGCVAAPPRVPLVPSTGSPPPGPVPQDGRKICSPLKGFQNKFSKNKFSKTSFQKSSQKQFSKTSFQKKLSNNVFKKYFKKGF